MRGPVDRDRPEPVIDRHALDGRGPHADVVGDRRPLPHPHGPVHFQRGHAAFRSGPLQGQCLFVEDHRKRDRSDPLRDERRVDDHPRGLQDAVQVGIVERAADAQGTRRRAGPNLHGGGLQQIVEQRQVDRVDRQFRGHPVVAQGAAGGALQRQRRGRRHLEAPIGRQDAGQAVERAARKGQTAVLPAKPGIPGGSVLAADRDRGRRHDQRGFREQRAVGRRVGGERRGPGHGQVDRHRAAQVLPFVAALQRDRAALRVDAAGHAAHAVVLVVGRQVADHQARAVIRARHRQRQVVLVQEYVGGGQLGADHRLRDRSGQTEPAGGGAGDRQRRDPVQRQPLHVGFDLQFAGGDRDRGFVPLLPHLQQQPSGGAEPVRGRHAQRAVAGDRRLPIREVLVREAKPVGGEQVAGQGEVDFQPVRQLPDRQVLHDQARIGQGDAGGGKIELRAGAESGQQRRRVRHRAGELDRGRRAVAQRRERIAGGAQPERRRLPAADGHDARQHLRRRQPLAGPQLQQQVVRPPHRESVARLHADRARHRLAVEMELS